MNIDSHFSTIFQYYQTIEDQTNLPKQNPLELVSLLKHKKLKEVYNAFKETLQPSHQRNFNYDESYEFLKDAQHNPQENLKQAYNNFIQRNFYHLIKKT